MQADSLDRPAPGAPAPAELRRAAFRDLHGSRLHGFALLVTLGDQAVAARLASEAIAEGSARSDELNHPERAAAWLRRHVVRAAGSRMRDSPDTAGRRRAALEELDVDAVAFASLAALDVRERAAVAAHTVERLDLRDVATIVSLDGTRLRRMLRRAHAKAVRSAGRALDLRPHEDGPITTRIRASAARTMT
jgi:DNA-directed RNA polymerase specialized sigma24 family protein